ncbi:glycosyltransferase [Pseudomonas putida]|uniref:glycosyltransferase n=1 Tax=Pseudomonas putida TaxID=303 RepID=UPI0018D81B6F|nr:glycosyltransferase [Pseudomonas putida]MBH3350809.1 glycosyltransferase [Pseudomonas putida]
MKGIEITEVIAPSDFLSLYGPVSDGMTCVIYYSQVIKDFEISGVCSFYKLLLSIWQIRDSDLQKQYDLASRQQRMQFVAWCVCHGGREYKALYQLDLFWLDLNKSFPVTSSRYSGGVSRLMLLWYVNKFKINYLPCFESGIFYKKLIQDYWFGGGFTEIHQPVRLIGEWQKKFLIDSGSIEETRFAKLLHDYRPDLKAAFNLDAEHGRTSYRDWLLSYGVQETPLGECFKRPLKSWPTIYGQPKELRNGVNLIGYAYGQLGIGEDVRMAARALDAAGVPFTIINFDAGPSVSNGDSSAARWVSNEPVYNINLICLTAMESLRLLLQEGAKLFSGRYNIGYWPWELELWPDNWIHLFSLVDELWASSRHIKRALDRVCALPVRLMPMAVVLDRPIENKKVLRYKFDLPSDDVLFVFSFDGKSSIARKNPVAIVEAFRLAFPLGTEKVGLIIKCMRPDTSDPAWIEIINASLRDARLRIIDSTLQKDEVISLYASCDCYVSLHRAEGYGRGIAEALLLEMEVIATGYGGNVDFCELLPCHLIPYQLVPVELGQYPEAAGNFWGEPSIVAASEAMRHIYEGYDSKIGRNFSSSVAVLETLFYPANVGRRYKKVIDTLYEMMV